MEQYRLAERDVETIPSPSPHLQERLANDIEDISIALPLWSNHSIPHLFSLPCRRQVWLPPPRPVINTEGRTNLRAVCHRGAVYFYGGYTERNLHPDSWLISAPLPLREKKYKIRQGIVPSREGNPSLSPLLSIKLLMGLNRTWYDSSWGLLVCIWRACAVWRLVWHHQQISYRYKTMGDAITASPLPPVSAPPLPLPPHLFF